MQRWEGHESRQRREEEHIVFWNWEAGEAKGRKQNGHWVEIQRVLAWHARSSISSLFCRCWGATRGIRTGSDMIREVFQGNNLAQCESYIGARKE